MSSTADTAEELHRRARRTRLWFGLVGGGIAWMLHLITAYAISEFGCVGWGAERHPGGISTVAWLELALTASAVATAGTATAVAYRCHSELRSKELSNDSLIADAFTARAGILTSGILTFVILFESIPIFFYLRSC